MRITALEPQAHHPERVNLYLDGSFSLAMSAELMLKLDLRVDQELSEADFAGLKEEEAHRQAVERAVNYLSFRPRSQAEVRRYLRRKATPPQIIEAVLERLQRQDYVDDRAFASFWRENREQFSPRGSQALRNELRMKGVDREIIDETVSDEHDEELALRAGRRKALTLLQAPEMDYTTFRNRLGGFLVRRGFTYDVVTRVVRTLWQEGKEEG
ncbi:MAG TPA: RecX family transcriptional regulator [Ktedonobacteraceae bacterium]|jgi:regulatory protein